MGDTITLPAPGGDVQLPIVGIAPDFSNQLGTIFMDREVFIRHYQDDSIDVFRVYLKKGLSAEDYRRRVVDYFGNSRRLFVFLNGEVKAYVTGLTDQWFGMTYLQVIVAVLVAVLGIINTLTVSIADRRREIGVLRAVGGLRRQIRGTVWMEAIAIGFIGLVLGMVVGAINLYYMLQALANDLTGMLLPYQFPTGVAMLLAPVILCAAFAAAILPGETAVRTGLVEALEYE
jgi:putative ABC transport system permease protein